ncbi:MAG: hypothetical protein JST75_11685 [Bacteroidetes bacterium]|nr:hypothetical protein [Bacteroidota bacterium]
MKLKIDSDSSIRDIQDQFNTYYPYLKIEFFKNNHQAFKLSAKADRIDPHKRINDLVNIDKSSTINIDEKTTVAVLEQQLSEKFGLSAQVFRKSGKLWIETSLTDNWTLDKQNREGEFISKTGDDGPKYDQPEYDRDALD